MTLELNLLQQQTTEVKYCNWANLQRVLVALSSKCHCCVYTEWLVGTENKRCCCVCFGSRRVVASEQSWWTEVWQQLATVLWRHNGIAASEYMLKNSLWQTETLD